MPAGVERIYAAEAEYIDSGGEDIDLPLKSSIEGGIIRWASIVNDILKQSSTLAFAGGAHPIPQRELEFWNDRLKNLECIFDQLRDPRVKKMAEYLEKTDSTYLPCFKTMFKNVVAGVVEARDICLYLKPLQARFAAFDENEFLESRDEIKPLIHCVALVWTNSRYYCSSDKVVTLLREIANMLIEAANRQLDPSSIFQGEADEMHDKIEKCIELLDFFMSSFEYVRNNLHSYFGEGVEPVPWSFHTRNVFQRLMDFIDRLRLVNSLLATNLEFGKLEKVEIGGIKGRLLSQKCVDIFEEFKTIYNVFANIQYEILSPEDKSIDDDYENFREKCDDLDRRLAAVFEQAFEECNTLTGIYKMLNIFGTLLERPVIYSCFPPVFEKVLNILDTKCTTVKVTYDESKKYGPPIDKYYPPVAGHLLFLYKLKKRIEIHYVGYKAQDFEEIEYSKHIFSKLDEMLEHISTDEKQIFENWHRTLPEKIERSLAKTHLIRTKTDLLKINMDDEFIAILREVRYMRDLEFDLTTAAPDAVELYARNEELMAVMMHLQRIVEWYNYMKQKTKPVEFKLIKAEIDELDVMLEDIITQLTWKTNSKYPLIKL